MSAGAVAWTYAHSPYGGATFAVHLALADAVSDLGDHMIWARQATIGEKARVSRKAVNDALATMISDGFLELVEDNAGRGRPNRYRFLAPDVPVVWQVSPPVTPSPQGVSPTVTPGVTTGYTEPGESSSVSGVTTAGRVVAASAGPPAPVIAGSSRRQDLIFEAVAEVCQIDWRSGLTATARGQLAKATKELKEATATPDEIRARAGRYRERYRGATLTPIALVKHWPQLVTAASDLPADYNPHTAWMYQ